MKKFMLVVLSIFMIVGLVYATPVELNKGKATKNIKPKLLLHFSDSSGSFFGGDLLEGMVIDSVDNTLLFSNAHAGNIYKADYQTGHFWEVWSNPNISGIASLDYHPITGELWGCAFHDYKIITIDIASGNNYTVKLDNINGYPIVPDDMVFLSDGNYFFTNSLGGNPYGDKNEKGSIYKIYEDGSGRAPNLILDNLDFPNGIDLTVDLLGIPQNRLIVSNTLSGDITRIDFLPPPYPYADIVIPTVGVGIVNKLPGIGPDVVFTDSKNNMYVAIHGSGKVSVLNPYTFEETHRILLPNRLKGDNLMSTGVYIHPDYPIGFITTTGSSGTYIYKFKALAKGQ